MTFLQRSYYFHEEKSVHLRVPSFEFKECAGVLRPTGIMARNINELCAGLKIVSTNSLYFHMCHYFMGGHILHYTNDFAQWAGESLEERELAEHLCTIDPYDCTDFEELRSTILDLLGRHLRDFPAPRDAMSGSEFYFSENTLIAFPIGVRVKNLAEFLMGIRYVADRSIYFHFYDARTRLGHRRNDFSAWLEQALGKHALAERLMLIDPFMHNLEGIRAKIVEAVEDEVKRDMEELPR